MKGILAILAAAVACVQPALAHYRFTSLIVNGVTTGEYQYVRQNTNYNSPVACDPPPLLGIPSAYPSPGSPKPGARGKATAPTSTTSNDLRCNTGGSSGANTQTMTVAAGSTVGFQMDQPIYHPGPILAYISKAPSTAAAYDGSGDWAKLYQIAPTFNSAGPVWNDAVGTFTWKLPSDLAAGQYLLRIEQIALHASPAQFYISCAQIQVTGSGSAVPPTGFKLPSGYSNAPGITIAGNIYYPIMTSYQMPGPAVWTG